MIGYRQEFGVLHVDTNNFRTRQAEIFRSRKTAEAGGVDAPENRTHTVDALQV